MSKYQSEAIIVQLCLNNTGTIFWQSNFFLYLLTFDRGPHREGENEKKDWSLQIHDLIERKQSRIRNCWAETSGNRLGEQKVWNDDEV